MHSEDVYRSLYSSISCLLKIILWSPTAPCKIHLHLLSSFLWTPSFLPFSQAFILRANISKLRQSPPLHHGAIFSCRPLPDWSTSLLLPLEWKQIWTTGGKNRLLWHQIMTLRCWSLPLKRQKHAYSVFQGLSEIPFILSSVRPWILGLL